MAAACRRVMILFGYSSRTVARLTSGLSTCSSVTRGSSPYSSSSLCGPDFYHGRSGHTRHVSQMILKSNGKRAFFVDTVALVRKLEAQGISAKHAEPDIAAPGSHILASVSPSVSGTGPLRYKIESATSMACPHMSGIVALLKSVHPDWSPAALKSALITTASVRDEFRQHITAEGGPYKVADPFDYRGGHVDPNKAIDPGLVYDMSMPDHVQFLSTMGYNNSAICLMALHSTICPNTTISQKDLNLPSISIPELRGNLTVTRTVTNVGPVPSVYRACIEPPPGVSVQVEPSILEFNSSVNKLEFEVSFHALLRVQGRYSFGSLSWQDGFHVVGIPLAVRTVTHDFYMGS